MDGGAGALEVHIVLEAQEACAEHEVGPITVDRRPHDMRVAGNLGEHGFPARRVGEDEGGDGVATVGLLAGHTGWTVGAGIERSQGTNGGGRTDGSEVP